MITATSKLSMRNASVYVARLAEQASLSVVKGAPGRPERRAQPPLPLGDVLALMRRTPWIARTRVGSTTIAAVLDQTARFELNAGTLRAVNSAARALDITTPGIRGALAGVFTLVNSEGIDPEVAGFALAPSYEAEVVQGVAAAMAGDRWMPSRRPTQEDRDVLASYLRDWSGWIEDDGWSANATGGWVDLGHAMSSELARLTSGQSPQPNDSLTGARIGGVVYHELQHLVTPRAFPFEHEHSWLEEGTAEVMTTWPGAEERATRSMGLPFGDGAPHGAYPDYIAAVRRLMGLAGVAGNRAATFALLQVPAPSEVLSGVADAVVRHHGLGRDEVGRVREAILSLRDFDGDDGAAAPKLLAAVARIEDLVSAS